MRSISTKRVKKARRTQQQFDALTEKVREYKDKGYSIAEIANATGELESTIRATLLRIIA